MSDILESRILASIKKLLGPEEDYNHFDPDIAIHINSEFNRLYQLGLKQAKGFRIVDGFEEWKDLFGPDDEIIDMVKSLIYLKVKLKFDPPSSSVLIDMFKEEIDKLEWSVNIWIEENEDGEQE